MTKKICISDEYDGIKYELVLWGEITGIDGDFVRKDFNPIYNLYLYLDAKRIPGKYNPESFLLTPEKYKLNEASPEREIYHYTMHPILSNIDFHGGITFYEKLSNGWIKVGCDYNHYRDHPSDFSFEYLNSNALTAIESFKRMIPDYKYWCCGNGKFYNASEGVIRKNCFYSKEYWNEKHPDWFNGGK